MPTVGSPLGRELFSSLLRTPGARTKNQKSIACPRFFILNLAFLMSCFTGYCRWVGDVRLLACLIFIDRFFQSLMLQVRWVVECLFSAVSFGAAAEIGPFVGYSVAYSWYSQANSTSHLSVPRMGLPRSQMSLRLVAVVRAEFLSQTQTSPFSLHFVSLG